MNAARCHLSVIFSVALYHDQVRFVSVVMLKSSSLIRSTKKKIWYMPTVGCMI